MNRQITRLAVAGVVLLSALIVATTYWQTWAAPGLADRQDNAIQRVAQFTIDRGEIVNGRRPRPARDEPRAARSGGKTLYFREYPQGGLAAHVVGYSTQARSRAGLERSMNDYLTALELEPRARSSTARSTTCAAATIQGNDVRLTLNPRAQRVAMAALGNRCGADRRARAEDRARARHASRADATTRTSSSGLRGGAARAGGRVPAAGPAARTARPTASTRPARRSRS